MRTPCLGNCVCVGSMGQRLRSQGLEGCSSIMLGMEDMVREGSRILLESALSVSCVDFVFQPLNSTAMPSQHGIGGIGC